LKALTGINSVIFYSSTIFGLAGFSESIIGTSCVGALNFVMTFIVANLIDSFGRKTFLLTGTYIMYVKH
jgi:MFS transporter, SP family, galactose:H+ symporter